MALSESSDLAQLLERAFCEEVAVIRSDLRISTGNDSFLAAHPDPLGRFCHEVLHGCPTTCRTGLGECPLHEVASTRQPVSVTILDHEQNSTKRHLKIDVYPVIPGHDEDLSFLHITRDITPRIEEERFKETMWSEVLRRMETIYSSMVETIRARDEVRQDLDFLTESLPLALAGWDDKGIITHWNSSAEVLFGWSSRKILGRPFMDLFSSGQSRQAAQAILDDILKGRTISYGLSDNRTASGRIISCEWYHYGLLDRRQGVMSSGFSMAQDVTERFQLREELTRHRDQLDAVLQASQEAIIGINQFGRITIWNRAAEKMTGWSFIEVAGQPLEGFIPPPLMKRHRKTIKTFLQEAREKEVPELIFDTTLHHRDSSPFPVTIKITSAVIESKPVLLGIIQDISVQKWLETILNQTEKARELGELSSGISHDFNNLLTILKAELARLHASVSDSAIQERLSVMESAVTDGIRKIGSLEKLMGSSVPHHQEGEYGLADLNGLIGEVVELTEYRWQDEIQKKGYTIELSTELGDLPRIPFDRLAMKDVLINLLFNAIDALTKGGKIHITSEVKESTVQVAIEDNGMGMTDEQARQIFRPFYSTKETGHAGLGLANAKETLTRHGGHIRVRSTLSVGTAITLELPMEVTAPLAAEKTDKNIISAPCRILLAEDNPLLRPVLTSLLKEAGHQILVAENGREAMELFTKSETDLVITDLGMPEMGGPELIERLKNHSPTLPIILLSGWADASQVAEVNGQKPDLVIKKPFETTLLLEKIDELLIRKD